MPLFHVSHSLLSLSLVTAFGGSGLERPGAKAVEVSITPEAPVLAGHGPATLIEYVVEHDGHLRSWLEGSGDFDPYLSISSASGEGLGEDDSSGGGKTPFLVVPAKAGQTLRIQAAAARPGESGSAKLMLVPCPETPATLAAVAPIQAHLGADGAKAKPVEEATLLAWIEALVAADPEGASEGVSSALRGIGRHAAPNGALQAARRAFELVLERDADRMPRGGLQGTRTILGGVLVHLDEHVRARVVLEQAVEIDRANGDADTADGIALRRNLAVCLEHLGDTEGTLRIVEELVPVCERVFGDRSREYLTALRHCVDTLEKTADWNRVKAVRARAIEVAAALGPRFVRTLEGLRVDQGFTLVQLGQPEAAKAELDAAFESLEQSAKRDDVLRLQCELNLGMCESELGQEPQAEARFQGIVERAGALGPRGADHARSARYNLGTLLFRQGRFEEARRVIEPLVLEEAAALGADDPDRGLSIYLLGGILSGQGLIHEARPLYEQAYDLISRVYPPEHPELLNVRNGLAGALLYDGDAVSALEHFDAIASMLARTLPPEHTDSIMAQRNLASALSELGQHERAAEIEEYVLAMALETYPPGDDEIVVAQRNLAVSLRKLGREEQGLELLRSALATVTARSNPDPIELASLQYNLAAALLDGKDKPRALELFLESLSTMERLLPSENPSLHMARVGTARACLELDAEPARARAQAALLLDDLDRTRIALTAKLGPRALVERAMTWSDEISTVLSIADGAGRFPPDPALQARAFSWIEALRGLELSAPRVAAAAGDAPAIDAASKRAEEAAGRLVELVQSGASPDRIGAARGELEAAQRELRAKIFELPGAREMLTAPTVESLAAHLDSETALVSLWTYAPWYVGAKRGDAKLGARTIAFVVTKERGLARVDLGRSDAMEELVLDWRDALGGDSRSARGAAVVKSAPMRVSAEREAGMALRKRAFDPLAPHLKGVRRLVVALGGPLALVPLDALPAERAASSAPADTDRRLGDEFQFELRSTLVELLAPDRPPASKGALLAMGGADFGGEADTAGSHNRKPAATFVPLPATLVETKAIVELHPGEDERQLTGTEATVGALRKNAPGARWLHVATHGWYDAVERSIELAGQASRDLRSDPEWTATTSPMIRCGLAFAQANSGSDALGRNPGTLTAEELSTLDLSRCELAVLSACETSLGFDRLGQGPASLQRALQIAGARTVVTSLWKVPDEPTKELMLAFYRRIWIDGLPKARALWEAKAELRAARDADGRPRYPPSAWAGWIAVGEPR
ncbi:MAG: CHAT domain-containing protein [Planctomycetes bacterium]|nr:CHAT domain-containing protein [Planctomycetota bacterium]